MEKSLQVLRSLKGKTAGAILALVKPDKAAKLTEQFLASSPAPKPPR
jgi:flagellar motility protein MotE (MotC chaperone)